MEAISPRCDCVHTSMSGGWRATEQSDNCSPSVNLCYSATALSGLCCTLGIEAAVNSKGVLTLYKHGHVHDGVAVRGVEVPRVRHQLQPRHVPRAAHGHGDARVLAQRVEQRVLRPHAVADVQLQPRTREAHVGHGYQLPNILFFKMP